MSNELTSTGLQTQSYEEVFTDLVTGFKGIYGEDIAINSEDPDGQMIGITAKLASDILGVLQGLYNSVNPSSANGIPLDHLGRIAGITRQLATNSTWDLVINCQFALTLPAGYTILDSTNKSWKISSDFVCVGGDNNLAFTALLSGVSVGSIGESITQSTIVLGVNSITALVAATGGTIEETDELFRIRRKKSVSYPATGLTTGLYAKLWDLVGVTGVNIIDNDTDITDVYGVPSHSIWMIVDGGVSQDIAKAFAVGSHTGGCGSYGAETVIYSEIITLNSVDKTVSKVLKFDRPTVVDLYITLNFTKTVTTAIIDDDLIKQSLANTLLNIGDSLNASSLYQTLYQNVSSAMFFDLLISDDNIAFIDTTLTPQPNEKYNIDIANIIVTEV